MNIRNALREIARLRAELDVARIETKTANDYIRVMTDRFNETARIQADNATGADRIISQSVETVHALVMRAKK